MKSLAFLSAVSFLSRVLLDAKPKEEVGHYRCEFMFTGSEYFDFDLSAHNIRNRKAISIANTIFPELSEHIDSDVDDVLRARLEQYLLSSPCIKNESITSISSDSRYKYRLKFHLNDCVVNTLLSEHQVSQKDLQVYFDIKSGYTITELAGEDQFNVSCPSGSVRRIDNRECDCRQFKLINRRKSPCRHLLLKGIYIRNKAVMIRAGAASLIV